MPTTIKNKCQNKHKNPFQLVKLETTGNETELLAERLRQTEKELTNIKKEAINYQNMLQQSQLQFTTLDRKYNKAKRLVREYQQREVDMVTIKFFSYLFSTILFLSNSPND